MFLPEPDPGCGCSVALLSIFYQERARKHFSIRDEAPLEPELANMNTIYSRDPGYILVLLHTGSPKETAIKNQMLIENISFPTISNEYLKLLLERKILNIYFFFPHRQMLVEIANTKKKY